MIVGGAILGHLLAKQDELLAIEVLVVLLEVHVVHVALLLSPVASGGTLDVALNHANAFGRWFAYELVHLVEVELAE